MKAYTVQIDDALAESLTAQALEAQTSVEALIVSAAAELVFGSALSAQEAAQIESGLDDIRHGRTKSQNEASVEVRARLGW